MKKTLIKLSGSSGSPKGLPKGLPKNSPEISWLTFLINNNYY